MTKQLTRSSTNKVISGVCGGFAEYFNIDASLVRIIWLVFSVFSAGFGGLIVYIACVVILPESGASPRQPYDTPPPPPPTHHTWDDSNRN